MDEFLKELANLIDETDFAMYEEAFAYTGFDVEKIRHKVKDYNNAAKHITIIFAYIKTRGTNYKKGMQKMSSAQKAALVKANSELHVVPKPVNADSITYGRLVAAFPMEFATILSKCTEKFGFKAYPKCMTFPLFAALIPTNWIDLSARHLQWCVAFNGIINPSDAHKDNLAHVGKFWMIARNSVIYTDEERIACMAKLGVNKRSVPDDPEFPAGIRGNSLSECISYITGARGDETAASSYPGSPPRISTSAALYDFETEERIERKKKDLAKRRKQQEEEERLNAELEEIEREERSILRKRAPEREEEEDDSGSKRRKKDSEGQGGSSEY